MVNCATNEGLVIKEDIQTQGKWVEFILWRAAWQNCVVFYAGVLTAVVIQRNEVTWDPTE